MTYIPLSVARRYVLGDLYSRCDTIESIPVYMEHNLDETIGFVNESLGKYADAFTFNLPSEVCKKLSSGHFGYSLGCDYAAPGGPVNGRRRIRLMYICLVDRMPTAKV